MLFEIFKRPKTLFLTTLTLLLLIPQNIFAQSQVLNKQDIHKKMLNATQTRQDNIAKVRTFLTTDKAQKAIKSADMDPARVSSAVSTLSDSELADLASRSEKAQKDFAAGRISDRDILLIVLGIAALVLIIVAVR